jgi:hypothetical protein
MVSFILFVVTVTVTVKAEWKASSTAAISTSLR